MATSLVDINSLAGAGDTDLERIPSNAERTWHSWYPSWDAWKFQRTLTYWISVMYLEGSLLFLAGAAFSLTPYVHGKASEFALVQTSYFVGGICFVIGSYMGVIEVMNVGEEGLNFILCPCGSSWRHLPHRIVSWKSFAGYGAFTIGALFYNANTIAGFFELTPIEDTFLGAMTAILGALCFLFGSVLECLANKVWHVKLTSGAWWLSISNLGGSLGFLFAGLALLAKVEGSMSKWLVDVPYLLGAVGFMIGALCTLWLWKTEQYGLGFIPEMNVNLEREDPKEDVLSMHEEYGCGRASIWQIPFLTMYLVNAVASVLNSGIAVFRPSHMGNDRSFQFFEAFLNFLLAHGVMLLGSILHHVPSARPHNWLVIYMRAVLALYTINSWINVFKHLDVLKDIDQ